MALTDGTYSDEDFRQMKRIEAALVQTVLPFRATTDPMLLAMALTRMTRTVARLCNPNDTKALIPVLVAFLEGKVNPPGGDGSLIWTPDQGPVPGLM